MEVLKFLSRQSNLQLWLLFLAENFLITLISLLAGAALIKFYGAVATWPTWRELRICAITNLINTAITYIGFKLWAHHYLLLSFSFNWWIIPHCILLFMAMDLAMYIFHYLIHHSFAYRLVHNLHHTFEHPTPIDLYVLHPFETVGFGELWLTILSAFTFNFYAVVIYLSLNVAFGIVGHLGIEPLPANLLGKTPFRWLGTSSFHHTHHSHERYNFGFYTTVWDRIFKTYKS